MFRSVCVALQLSLGSAGSLGWSRAREEEALTAPHRDEETEVVAKKRTSWARHATDSSESGRAMLQQNNTHCCTRQSDAVRQIARLAQF